MYICALPKQLKLWRVLLEASLDAHAAAWWLFLEAKSRGVARETVAGLLLAVALPPHPPHPPHPATWTQPTERWCNLCLQACAIHMLRDRSTATSPSPRSSIAAVTETNRQRLLLTRYIVLDLGEL
jgi:hypothetical protein